MDSTAHLLRKTALGLATAACLASLAVAPARAQGATGALAGRGSPGDQITITNASTGFSRSVTVEADGSYRLSQLPVGEYRLQVERAGQRVGQPLEVSVPLGGTATINLGDDGGLANLDVVRVVGSRVINRVDVYSTETTTNITREELARVPVDQTLGSVALLAPGVIGGNASFGGISFGGSSVAENSIFVNGLNVTDFYRRQSFSTAPFAFYDEFQVKTGGYSVEFGRSTGGVINAVTRRGSNEFKGGIQTTFEPAAWRAEGEDRLYADGSVNVRASRDRQTLNKANLWASGPLVRDKVFLFAMYEWRDNPSRFTNAAGNSLSVRESSNGFWGGKLDWQISDDHLIELLAFSDEGDSLTRVHPYTFATATVGSAAPSLSSASSGGTSGSVTYTGHFGQNFTAKAMYGINRSSAYTRSPADGVCNWITYNNASYGAVYRGLGSPVLGCHPGSTVVSHEDERKAKRLDFEWALGDHLLRFGWDHELMTTDRVTFYPGNGVQYTAYGRTSPTQVLDNGTPLPAGVNAFLFARKRADGGVFDIKASAWYLEDVWNVTSNLLVNVGLRLDSFENLTAAGTTFTKTDNLLSPRLGFSWDMKGDGSTKLFGNLGRYYMPIPSIVSYNFAGGLLDERTFYVLDGWRAATNPVTGAPYLEPIVGAQIGPVDDQFNLSVRDLRQSVDRDLDAVYQDEAILGFQSMINAAWSWGVNATYRTMRNAMDDVRINALCGVRHGTLFPIANPGDKLTLWGTRALGCAQDGWVTIDTSKEGYITSTTNQIVGYSKPERTYTAVEFQLDRAWDGKWAFNGSYLWSRSEGNHEGPVNSDTNYADTAMVQHWDHPANNQDYGPLFNDRTHQVKLRGSYELNDMWSFGATLSAQSGGPINAFGVTWPNDSLAAGSVTSIGSGGGSFWHCIPPADKVDCSSVPVANRVYRYAGRGWGGRLPWTYNLGANVTWSLPVPGVDLKLRFSVFNLLDQQRVINVSQRYEAQPGERRSTWGTGTRWQSPRYMQLVMTWNF